MVVKIFFCCASTALSMTGKDCNVQPDPEAEKQSEARAVDFSPSGDTPKIHLLHTDINPLDLKPLL
ncbi:hypothetical protein EMGBS15_18810 [Filimonas sp.]|nr:hypothetical protein EMGBS15_18810 [Filimonas sp.]